MDKPRQLDRRPVHQGHVISVSVDRVQLPNGHTLDLDIVSHPGAAAIVPVDAQGDVILVRQVRYATDGWLLEVPAGKLDPGEDARTCAARELEEETGHVAETLTPMGCIWTSPGFCNERIWLFLATGLRATHQALDADEQLLVERLPLKVAVERATTGDIDDAKTVCALLRAAHHMA